MCHEKARPAAIPTHGKAAGGTGIHCGKRWAQFPDNMQDLCNITGMSMRTGYSHRLHQQPPAPQEPPKYTQQHTHDQGLGQGASSLQDNLKGEVQWNQSKHVRKSWQRPSAGGQGSRARETRWTGRLGMSKSRD